MDTACGSKPPQSKKVCVIGAGMAGLAAARELRREGHDVTVLEQSGDVGGQWLYNPRTDAADALGVAAPVKVHSSIYASLRLISPRQTTGFTDFPFCPKSGRDGRRFPGHREVHLYLKDFCHAFGLMEAVRLNTRVLRAAMTPARTWAVRSMDLGLGGCDGADGKGLDAYVDEVFDAVVVATGHYSQPRLPSIEGMETWRGRHMHSHSYRVPEPFRGEVVVVVGCGDSGRDIAMEIRGVAKEVYIVAGSMEAVTPGLSKVLAKYSANLHLRLEVERLCEDGRVAFKDGGGSSSSIAADAVIYCTGYNYSFPFLDTGGVVAVDDNRVGPLFEHVFPPSLAPSLSFVGLLRKVFAPRSFEAQARWVAQVLSGRRKLPTKEEMLRSVDEFYRAKEIAGVPSKYTHEVGSLKCSYVDDFGEKYCDFPRQERWQYELLRSTVHDMVDKFETFRDDYQDSDSIGKAVQEWHLSCLHSSSKAGSEVSRAGAKPEPGASKYEHQNDIFQCVDMRFSSK
ncbi:unnamed protein product [Triticum turgidum subsp. durum]|uniref:Flavin-containing monooxygenase n=1 Tax=Triticum turgidum subsp. durum TaxID=4567 RepID=A0A9R0R7Q8_TRITD|nr:unnamed protein product [Triticum turgidum subsp. durum]